MSYQEACTIFFMVCKNKILAGNLLKSDKPSNQEKLNYEVKKLLEASNIDWRSAPRIELPKTTILKKQVNQPTYTSLPSFDSPLKTRVLDERKALYLERGHLHGRLHEVESDQEAKELAIQILSIQTKIDEYNRDLRQIENNEIPNRYLKTTASGEEVLRMRNLKIYIARYKKELQTATDPTRIKVLNKKLNEFETELGKL